MTTPADFASAQQRILARRAAHQPTLSPPPPVPPPTAATLPSRALLALPTPLRTLLATAIPHLTSRTPLLPAPAFRVGQLDSSLLDAELHHLVKSHAVSALRLLPTPLRAPAHDAELDLALAAALWKLGVWDRGATYGATLQGLRFESARGAAPSRMKRAVRGAVGVGGAYLWRKGEEWVLERGEEGGWARVGVAWAGAVHEAAALVGFLVFLVNGRYRTLLDRALGLRLVPVAAAGVGREVSFEYLNRQLVWHAFTEFLLFILPLVGVARWRRWIARAWGRVKALVMGKGGAGDEDGTALGELGFLPERTCAICYRDQNLAVVANGAGVGTVGSGGVVGSAQTDVTNPYETIPCGHVYCFACLAQRIEAEEGEGWTCLRCAEVVKECRPWTGDVLEEPAAASTSGIGSKAARKSVVFADETEVDRVSEKDDGVGELSPVDPMAVEDELHEQLHEEVGGSTEWVGRGEDESDTAEQE